MNINIEKISQSVIPKLTDSINKLEDAAKIMSEINVHSEYAYWQDTNYYNNYETLKKFPQNIRDIKKNVISSKNWVNDIKERFEKAERDNNNIVNSLIGNLGNTTISNNMKNTGGVIAGVASVATITNLNNPFSLVKNGIQFVEFMANTVTNGTNSVGAIISSAWNSLVQPAKDMFESCKAKVSNFVTSAVNEISNGINKVREGITNFAQKGWEKMCKISQNVENAIQSAGAHISSVWNSFVNDILPKVGGFFTNLGASVANMVTGLIKGIGQFVESVGDFVLMLGTGVASIFTGIYDGVSYLISKANGTTNEWKSRTGEIWEEVMSHVAEDHVGNAFEDFYKNTIVGQWLDENAWDWCKSNGILTNIASGIGYVAGIVALTIATFGAGRSCSWRCFSSKWWNLIFYSLCTCCRSSRNR